MEQFAEHLKDLRDVDDPKRQEGIQYLQQICTNILNDPSNPKFRDLNHEEIAQKLAQCQPALILLFDVGFTLSKDNQRLQLKADDFSINNIRNLQNALEAGNATNTVQISTICYCHQPLTEINSRKKLSEYICRSCSKPLEYSSFDCQNRHCKYKRITKGGFWICPSCYQQDVYITFNDTDEGRKQVFVSKLKSHIETISFVSVNIIFMVIFEQTECLKSTMCWFSQRLEFMN